MSAATPWFSCVRSSWIALDSTGLDSITASSASPSVSAATSLSARVPGLASRLNAGGNARAAARASAGRPATADRRDARTRSSDRIVLRGVRVRVSPLGLRYIQHTAVLDSIAYYISRNMRVCHAALWKKWGVSAPTGRRKKKRPRSCLLGPASRRGRERSPQQSAGRIHPNERCLVPIRHRVSA
eukprot:scaffold3942_cov123-Isochrysis_galbana.AAC.17